MRSRGSGVVLVDRAAEVRDYSSVAVDDVRGGHVAVEHLVSLGARQVAIVNGPTTLTSRPKRPSVFQPQLTIRDSTSASTTSEVTATN